MTTYATYYNTINYHGLVLDQGDWGTCVPNSIVSSIDFLMRQAGHEIPLLSRMQLYYDARAEQGLQNVDGGTSSAVALFAAEHYGIAAEWVWDYSDAHLFTKAPNWIYESFAPQYKVDSFAMISKYQTSEQIRDNVLNYLSQGKTVITSFKVRDFFYNEKGNLSSLVGHGNDAIEGNHAVEIVGWDSNIDGGSYIVKNSWNTTFGDKGYGVISYKQFGTNALYGSDDLLAMEVVTGMDVDNKYYNFKYSDARTTANKFYVEILSRPGDVAGIDWQADHNLYGLVHTEVFADLLINSTEGQSIYAGMNDVQFVNQMYQNLLSRNGEQAGLDYWTGLIGQGYSRGWVAAHMLEAIEQPTGEAHQTFDNKMNLANYITIALQYNGNENNVVSQAVHNVTNNVGNVELIKIGLPHDLGVVT